MQDVFITKIHMGKVRHLEDVDIALSDTKRKHLILTGKNGSGKTSVLEAMRNAVLLEQRNALIRGNKALMQKVNNYLLYDELTKHEITVIYSGDIKNFLDVIFAYIPADRSEPTVPKSIEPVDIQGKTIVTRNASKDFLKYIVSLDYRLYGAQQNGNTKLTAQLSKWFDNFTQVLREIYDCRQLQLLRDADNVAFNISMPDRDTFALHEMSDGYTAFLDIYMELLMRLASEDSEVQYGQSAIVMIDEIETHLHVELQKRVLPFLTRMFPNIQFIVATHSPFVITSLENAIVYDLEKKERLENPSIYSYEAVVESYLNVGQYSNEIRDTFNRYKELYNAERSDAENVEFQELVSELEMVPPASKELYLAFRTMEDKRKR